MTREASSESSTAQTNDEVSGLRFGCVLTVCSKVKLGTLPYSLPPPPMLPFPCPAHSISSPGAPLPSPPAAPHADADNTALRKSSAKGIRVHSNRKEPKAPLNDRDTCQCISPSSAFLLPLFRTLPRLAFSSISLSPSFCEFFLKPTFKLV